MYAILVKVVVAEFCRPSRLKLYSPSNYCRPSRVPLPPCNVPRRCCKVSRCPYLCLSCYCWWFLVVTWSYLLMWHWFMYIFYLQDNIFAIRHHKHHINLYTPHTLLSIFPLSLIFLTTPRSLNTILLARPVRLYSSPIGSLVGLLRWLAGSLSGGLRRSSRYTAVYHIGFFVRMLGTTSKVTSLVFITVQNLV